MSHKDYSHAGSWTIFPLLLHLSKINLPNVAWLLFLEDYTGVNVIQIIKQIEKYDHSEVNFFFKSIPPFLNCCLQKLWIGNELYDEDATIIHHFAFHQNPNVFKYPNIASGFAISIALFERFVGISKVLCNFLRKQPFV